MAERGVREEIEIAKRGLANAIMEAEKANAFATGKALEMSHARIRLEALEGALERMERDVTGMETMQEKLEKLNVSRR